MDVDTLSLRLYHVKCFVVIYFFTPFVLKRKISSIGGISKLTNILFLYSKTFSFTVGLPQLVLFMSLHKNILTASHLLLIVLIIQIDSIFGLLFDLNKLY